MRAIAMFAFLNEATCQEVSVQPLDVAILLGLLVLRGLAERFERGHHE